MKKQLLQKTTTIQVPIEEVRKGTMFLHEHFGDGSIGKIKFEADQALPTNSPYITIEGKRYICSMGDIVKAMVNFHLDNKKK